MKKLMIRKPEMYKDTVEAAFTPGIGMTLVVWVFLYVANFMLRDIPAYILDLSYYSQQPMSTTQEATLAIMKYMTSPWTMIAALFMTSIMIALTIVYIRGIEKRSVSTIGLIRKGAVRKFAAGYAIGVGLLILTIVPWLIAGQTEYKPVSLVVIAVFLIAFIVQAASEEIFFRGFLLSSIYRKSSAVFAVLLSSAMFAVIHVSNHDVTVLIILEMFFTAVLYAFYTLRTGSLWGAIGIHAAWNFTLGLVSTFTYSNLVNDHAIIKIGSGNLNSAALGDTSMLILIGLDIVVIALVLFAGKNRLVVQMNEQQLMCSKAVKTAKQALRRLRSDGGEPLVHRALSIAGKIEGDKEKSAALLYLACSEGEKDFEELSGQEFSGELLKTVELLIESPGDRVSSQVRQDPAALAVMRAIIRYTDENAGSRKQSKKKTNKVSAFCPLLRRDIDEQSCEDIREAVDTGSGGGFADGMDINFCRKCPKRKDFNQKKHL